MAFSNDTRGRTIQGRVGLWGSTKGDSIDSFGTAACHIQVWDAWPDENTTWIPQYMCALHFNPSLDRTLDENSGSTVTVKNYANATKNSQGEFEVKPTDFEINIQAPSLVSYRVPTYGDEVTISWIDVNGDAQGGVYPSYGTGLDGQSVGGGVLQAKLRPQNLWNTETHREGALVTKYGYHHSRTVLGVHKGTISDKEEGFKTGKDNIYTIGRGEKEVRFWIDNGNNVVFDKIKWKDNELEEHTEDARGAGYLPADLPVRGTIKDSNGKTANISFSQIYAYGKHYHDVGPRPRSSLTRVSLGSGQGDDRVWGSRAVSIPVEGNKIGADTDLTLYSGQYEILVYVHNDVSFAWHKVPETTSGYAMAQYITMKLL